MGRDQERYLLIAVEHLTSWQLVRATKTSTADTVVKIVEEEIFQPFGTPHKIVSDNTNWFTAAKLMATHYPRNLLKNCGRKPSANRRTS